jgi:apolipoprotein N-acyltransferase
MMRHWRPFPRTSARLATNAFLLQLALAVAAGALHGAGWLFPGAWYVVWAAQSLLILLGAISSAPQAFAFGCLTGAIGIGCSFYWSPSVLAETIDASPLLAGLIYALLVAVEASGFGLFCAACAWGFRERPWTVWLVSCAWVSVEFWYPRIFPWMLGYSQLEVTPLLQIAELFGSTSIGFVVTAAAATPIVLILRRGRWSTPEHRREAKGYAVAASALLAATVVYGLVRIEQFHDWTAKEPKLKVALLQVKTSEVGSDQKLADSSLAVHDHVDLICWPESAIGIYSAKLAHFRNRDETLKLSRDSRDSLEPGKGFRAHLLAGGKLYADDQVPEDGPYSMAALLIGPEQEILGRYRKRTLLPFGEYIPGQSYYPPIREWATLTELIVPGTEPGPLLTTQKQPLGVLICYEDVFPVNARETVAAGAQVLIALIQGDSFKNQLTLRQHQRLAVMRAIENRRYFARCSSTGVTCLISPTGETIAELPMQAEQTLTGEVVLSSYRTLYNRVGDFFPWGCTCATLAGLFASFIRPGDKSRACGCR